MRLILVRHAESEGNVDERAYAEYGDSQVPITLKGVEQSRALGRFLREYFPSVGITEWPLISLSSYVRPQQTFRGLCEECRDIFPGDPDFHVDLRLAEQSFGFISFMHQQTEEPDKALSDRLYEFSKMVRKKNHMTAAPLFGESPVSIIDRIKGFIDGTLQRDMEKHENIMIVSHGAIMKAFLMNWFHLPAQAWLDMKNTRNCDVIVIEGEPRNWTVKKIYDGVEMKPCDLNPIEGFRRLTYKDLPPLPGTEPA